MQLKANKWIVLLVVVIHTTTSTTQDQEPMDSDYFYQDTELDDTSGYNNEAQDNVRKYFFSSMPRAALFPTIEQQALAAADITTECIPERPEKTTTTECATSETSSPNSEPETSSSTSSTSTAQAPISTTAAPAVVPSGGGGASASTTQSPGPSATTSPGTSTGTTISPGTSAGISTSTATSMSNGPSSSSSNSMSTSVAGIGNFNTHNPQTSDQEAKSKELRNLVQHLYIAQARVQLEATEIKKSQAVANVAQQQLEEAAGHVRTVTAALQNAQQEVAAAAIRAQTAQLQLAAHDQLLFAARQDVDALSSQMVGLQAAEGISAPRITFDVTGLLEKLKQPLPEEQKPTPVPSVVPMPHIVTPKTTKVQRSALQDLYYE